MALTGAPRAAAADRRVGASWSPSTASLLNAVSRHSLTACDLDAALTPALRRLY